MTTRTTDERAGRIARTLLAHQGRRQHELADVLGLDSGQVSRALRGQRRWTLDEIAAMAAFFDVGVATFFDDPDLLIRNRCFATGITTQSELVAA